MSECRKLILAYVFIVVVCVTYFGCGYYFGVTRPARLHQSPLSLPGRRPSVVSRAAGRQAARDPGVRRRRLLDHLHVDPGEPTAIIVADPPTDTITGLEPGLRHQPIHVHEQLHPVVETDDAVAAEPADRPITFGDDKV